MDNINNIDSILTALKNFDQDITYKKLCEWNKLQREKYQELLNKLKETNSSHCSNQTKGIALESIATFLLETCSVFKVYKNIKTTTNELDQLVRTTSLGSILCNNGILDKRLLHFIGECKNYKDTVSVTYVGKICGLLTTTNNRICILFSYNGISGKNWEDASGLVKKFYLSKEKNEDRYCIIDFNIKDFELINDGNNFLQIINDKIASLQYDTDYLNFINKEDIHESIEEILIYQSN